MRPWHLCGEPLPRAPVRTCRGETVPSPPCARQKGPIMEGAWFDRMARRQALRRMSGGLAGGMLAALGLGHAATAQPTGHLSSSCRQCIAMFQGQCVATCVRSELVEPEACPDACFEGVLTACTILGECA
jgi:hypothetical protein